MAVLFFRDEEAVRLALESGAVPDSLTGRPARFASDAKGRLWVQPETAVPRSAINALARLGVRVLAESELALDHWVQFWPQLIALRRQTSDSPSDAPVLFEVSPGSALTELATELHRLRPGQSTWQLSDSGERSLVRVDRAPYLSLLRAAGAGDSPRAYLEQSPRVWVEFGYRFPMARPPSPTPGSIALLSPPRDWRIVPLHLDAGPPPTITLPPRSLIAADQEMAAAVSITPRLHRSPTTAEAELWLLDNNSPSQLHEWLRRTDDRLIARLTAAAIQVKNESFIAIMARHGATMPAALGLDAIGFRSYLKLPNLYLPCDRHMMPTMRRDAARRHFAPNADRIVWLSVNDRGELASTTAARNAFRPLADWLRYATPASEQVIVKPPSPFLSLEPFEGLDRPASAGRSGAKAVMMPRDNDSETRPGLLEMIVGWARGAWQFRATAGSEPDDTPIEPAPKLEPAPQARSLRDDRSRIAVAESTIAEKLSSGLTVTESDWESLASAYAHAGRASESATAWLQVLWLQPSPTIEAAWGWLRAEAASAEALGTPDDFTHWLTSETSPARIRSMAAFAVRGAVESPPPPALTRTLGATQEMLERHESWLPIRAVWLARLALTQLCGGDPLALARTRDRLFERLFEHGLRVDQDVPAFLRSAGSGDVERLPIVREWLVQSNESAHRWIGSRSGLATEQHLASDRLERFGLARERQHTPRYLDLLWAWGLARAGEEQAVYELVRRAREQMPADDAVHVWLADAFEHRISQALAGRGIDSPWPSELLLRLSRLNIEQRYAIDRMRQYLRILEPSARINAFRVVRSSANNAIAALAEITDREELCRRAEDLLLKARPNAAGRAQVVVPLLEVAVFGGERLAKRLLEQLLADMDALLSDPWAPAALARAFGVAAATQLADPAKQLVSRTQQLIRRGRTSVADLEPLIAAAVRALRSLNQRDDLSALITSSRGAIEVSSEPSSMKYSLAIASGWLALGEQEKIGSILDDVRQVIFAAANTDAAVQRERLDLALAYISALGVASPRFALGRYGEILQRLPAPADAFVTNAYFALSPLRVLDAMVRGLVDDPSTSNPLLRRFFDEDELQVRRRIREDVDAAIGLGP